MIIASLLIMSPLQSADYGSHEIASFTRDSTVDRTIRFHTDIDGDGIPEMLVSDYTKSSGGYFRNGRLDVLSGSNRALLATLTGSADEERLGQDILPCEDLDGDGIEDFLASRKDGTVTAFSGSHFGILYRTVSPWAGSIMRAPVLTYLEDVNGDQIRDFTIADGQLYPPGSSVRTGAIAAYSGASGSLLWSQTGTNQAPSLGEACTPIGDVDSDGIGDLVASSMHFLACYSATSGALLWEIDHPGVYSTQTTLASLSDINGDGIAEFALGSRYSNAVHVLSGSNGSNLYTVPPLSHDWRFGFSLLAIEDLNGDGMRDLLAGSPETRFQGSLVGWVYLLSGADGERLGSFPGDSEYRYFADFGRLMNAGDWNGDGSDDWAATMRAPSLGPSLITVRETVEPVALQVTGTCPGPVSININNGTPSGHYGIAVGPGGTYELDGGPVDELLLGIGHPKYRTLRGFDATGSDVFAPTLHAGVCGMSLQVFDLTTRATSEVVIL